MKLVVVVSLLITQHEGERTKNGGIRIMCPSGEDWFILWLEILYTINE
jgi:hypothetical protein